MSKHRRVLWNEGMLLSPQHFQQADRAIHHLLAERFRTANAFDFGLTHLELDREALRNGRMSLIAARGVLPDGSPFALPDEDPLPPPRAIEGHFDSKSDAMLVHLGIPMSRSGRAQLGEAGAPSATAPRFAADAIYLQDDNTGRDEREVMLARRNFALLFPDDAVSEYDALPIAEVVRASDGTYALREGFVPPCLAIGASETLLRHLRAELERLIAKSTELSGKRRERGGGIADFGSGDMANSMQLFSVNTYIPVLSHYIGHRRAHPEQVYLTLASLAGQLCAFSTEFGPRDLPSYEHGALARSFENLHGVLSKLLKTTSVEKWVRIDLEKKDGGVYVGNILDPRLVEPGATLFLGIRADVEEQRLINEVPVKVKIASYDKIDVLIAQALRGVPLLFQRQPPAALPLRAATLYFQLEPKGDVWETVKGAKNVAIFAPPDIPGVTLELLGLRD